MDFLLNYGIDNNGIDEIIKNNDSSIIYNVILNKKNVLEVLDYLKEIGVNDNSMKDLFLHQIGMFFRTKDEIRNVFDEYEMDSIIKSLNYDVNTVDLIEF